MSSARIDRALALASISTALVLALSAPQARAAETYRVRSLVSDGGVPAAHKDKNLVNGWGIAFGRRPRLGRRQRDRQVDPLRRQRQRAAAGRHHSRRAPRPASSSTARPASWSARARSAGQPVHLRQRGRGRLRLVAERRPEQRHRGVHRQGRGHLQGPRAGDAGRSRRLYATDFHNGKVDVLDERFTLGEGAGRVHGPEPPQGLRAVRHPERRRQAGRHLRQAGRRPARRRPRAGPRLRRPVRRAGAPAQAPGLARGAERAVGHRPGTRRLRPARRRPPGRQLRRRRDQRLRPGYRRVPRHASSARASRSRSTASGALTLRQRSGHAAGRHPVLRRRPRRRIHGQYGRIDVVSHH